MDEVQNRSPAFWVIAIILVLFALGSRVLISYYLANDAPGDGVIYARLADNIRGQGVYSLSTKAPFEPTLVRLPGYPFFVACIYAVFGVDNNTAVRIVQAVFDTGTCVLVALLAGLWTEDERRKRRNAFFAFLLAALCPFIAIYAANILSETLTTFFMAAMALSATLALKAKRRTSSFVFWVTTGLLAGAAVLLRPDSGLFAAGLGVTLLISEIFLPADDEAPPFSKRLFNAFWKGSVFSLAFVIVLAPWTLRNYRVFGVIQPVAPTHAEMPGEFVSYGYFRWLRTWIDDSRFIEPMLWNLNEKPIRIGKIPAQAFDSADERDRVAALLEQYDRPPGSETLTANSDEDNSDEADPANDSSDDTSDAPDTGDEAAPADENSGDTSDTTADSSEEDNADVDENKKYFVKMTPEIDAAFGQIADKRIARSPARYYLFVPAKRAASLWFDSHSLYYPFGGQMSPVSDLDYDESQQYWLPAFTLLVWIYTLLAIGGAKRLWRERANRRNLRWLILIALMTLPRLIFFSTMENPEPRYVVELFAFCSILGAFYLGDVKFGRSENKDSDEAPAAPGRMLSLDAFRGITIAAMVLVNDPGSWSAIYGPLKHAEWNGVTPTDLIFPFFLFIVGVSITFAFKKRSDDGESTAGPHYKIVKRTVILFGVGLLLEIFPFYDLWTAEWFNPGTMRIMGVLQRIAICYLVAAIVFLHTGWRQQVVITVCILLAYWALMTLVNVPGCDLTTISDQACNLAAYIDRIVLTEGHIWNQSRVFDPEGLLSTLPAIATTLAGVLAGKWLRSGRSPLKKVLGMLEFGIGLTAAGWIWSFWFPLNKSLWTSSLAVYTAGIALLLLAACYYVIDIKRYTRWAMPFFILGLNAIALYAGSTIMGRVLEIVELSAPNDKTVSLQNKIFEAWFLPLGSPENASMLYAVAFILVWLLLMWQLYRKKIVVKI